MKFECSYLEGTNKKAFLLKDCNREYLFTYATLALYTDIKTKEKYRVWNNYRPNSGKHLLTYCKDLHKTNWLAMEIHNPPCTGSFVFPNDIKAVKVKFNNNIELLIINGSILLMKDDTGKFYRYSDNILRDSYTKYVNEFMKKEITKLEWKVIPIII